MSVELRALRPDEREAVIQLWGEVFADDEGGYFRHYFDADPAYQDADCLVAVVDGQLVSAVHICRRRMEWEGRELLCGCIANVATRKAHQRQGYSRNLLRAAVARMEAERFAFSLLFTGRFQHYGAVGWQQVQLPSFKVKLAAVPPASSVPIRRLPPEPVPAEVIALYDAAPHRPLHMARPGVYFPRWTGWFWKREIGTTLLLSGPAPAPTGYAVVVPGAAGEPTRVWEMRALSAEAEEALLLAAVQVAREFGATHVELGFIPQFGGEAVAQRLGEIEPMLNGYAMLRSITLPPDEMGRITAAYETGQAVFWSGDDF